MARPVGQRACARKVRTLIIIVGVSIAGAGGLYAKGGHTVHSILTLKATSNAPGAHGKAHLTLQSSKKGKFSLTATHLTGNTTYDVIVRGVKVTQIHTSSGGSGKALFSTKPGTKAGLLGFDPSGGQIMVRNTDDGDDVLVGDMPEDNSGVVACCLSQGEDGQGQTQVECEQTSAAECTGEGGTVGMAAGTTATVCLPDPCATMPPPGGSIVCCSNATDDDASEAECEVLTTQADCADNNGTVVQATSCTPNPCQVTPPVDQFACCLTQTDDGETETECEVISSAACTAQGGMVGMVAGTAAATCDTDPCGIGSGGGGGGGGGGGDNGGD